VAVATILAALLEPAFDHLLPQPPMPRGRRKQRAVFPSGHAFVPTAVLLTSAYVLARQDAADARVVYPVAVVLPAALAGAKLLAEKHWPSDVLAGWIAGVALSAGCVAAYEASG
jgi:undecaprenyl-diphosphatase